MKTRAQRFDDRWQKAGPLYVPRAFGGIGGPSFGIPALLKPAAAGGGPSDITDSLRLRYQFPEGTGSTTADSSGNGFTGTLAGGTPPSWSTINANSCLSFADAASEVTVGTTFLGTGDKSITFWMRLNAVPGTTRYICSDVTKFVLGVDSNGRIFVSGDASTTTAVSTFPGTIVDSTLFFVAVTVTSAGTCNIYINGTLNGTADQATGTPATSAFNFSLGTPFSIDGKLDDFRVYDRILTSGEVSTCYTAQGANY